MKKIFLALLAAVVLPLGFAACSSDDDNDNNGSGTEHGTKRTNWDDLKYFQHIITDLDSLGNLQGYHYGKQLYKDTDPGHLYIGVDEWSEAEEIFREWLAKDVTVTTLTPTTNGLKAELTDTLGKAQLTVYLKPATSSTNVAEVTVSDESKLKYFYQITFMLNSAWPQNAKTSNHWKKFDILYEGYADGIGDRLDSEDYPLNWVCIRSSGNGKRPFFVALSKNEYKEYNKNKILKSRYSPDKDTSDWIYGKFEDDLEIFVATFQEAGCGPLENDVLYLINDYYSKTYYPYDFYNGTQTGLGIPTQRVALKFDWYDDDEVHDDMTIEEDHNKDDD